MSEEMDFAQLVAQEEEIKLLEAENKRLREALEAVQAGKEEEALRRIEASRDAPELNSGDMLAFCGSPAMSFPKG